MCRWNIVVVETQWITMIIAGHKDGPECTGYNARMRDRLGEWKKLRMPNIPIQSMDVRNEATLVFGRALSHTSHRWWLARCRLQD
jgi:hypothetical protein